MMRSNFQIEIALAVSVFLHAIALAFSVHQEVMRGLISGRQAVADARLAQAQATPQTITFVEEPAPRPAAQKPKRDEPRTFIETQPGQVNGQEPEFADFYSDKSTVAANPENPSGKTGSTPYLDGKETRLLALGNVPGSAAARPAPPPSPPALKILPAPPPAEARAPVPTPPHPPAFAPAPEPAATEPQKSVAEKGAEAAKPTQVALAPRETLPQPAGEKPPATIVAPAAAAPATESIPSAGGASAPASGTGGEIASARSRLSASGAARTGVTAFNVKSSPFGAYDQKIVRAVQSRWYALIQKYGIYERAGQVTVHFQLLNDGTITNPQITDNTAGDILALYCQKAIADSAPFDPLPDALRVLVGNEPRDVSFTFYY